MGRNLMEMVVTWVNIVMTQFIPDVMWGHGHITRNQKRSQVKPSNLVPVVQSPLPQNNHSNNNIKFKKPCKLLGGAARPQSTASIRANGLTRSTTSESTQHSSIYTNYRRCRVECKTWAMNCMQHKRKPISAAPSSSSTSTSGSQFPIVLLWLHLGYKWPPVGGTFRNTADNWSTYIKMHTALASDPVIVKKKKEWEDTLLLGHYFNQLPGTNEPP